MGEAVHVNKIVNHRGEGLSDLLFMKKDFNKHMLKVSIYIYSF